MSTSISNLSQKQLLLVIVGIIAVFIILLVVGNMYGSFLKTQVKVPQSGNYSIRGDLKSNAFQDPGNYVLEFQGQDASGANVTTNTQFEIVPIPQP